MDILKGKTTYTTSDMDNSKLDLQKTSDRYMALLKQKTNEMRRATSNPYFKYDEEDNVISFNKREYLEDLPKYKLDTLRKHYKIKRGWSKYSIISELLKKADIDEQIMLMINEDKHIKISEEDLAFIKASAYKT